MSYRKAQSFRAMQIEFRLQLTSAQLFGGTAEDVLAQRAVEFRDHCGLETRQIRVRHR
jgi:hypothetical protein